MIEVLTLHNSSHFGLERPKIPTHEVPTTQPWRDVRAFNFLRQLPRQQHILATIWNPEASLAWLAQKKHVTVLAHGNELMPYPTGLMFKTKDMLRRHVLGVARAVICASHYTERLVQRLNSKAKTVVICPAVEADRYANRYSTPIARRKFKLPTNKRIILSVSRLDTYKGHDVTLQALAQLSHGARSLIHYAVAGRGEHLFALQQLATRLKVDENVSWLGFVEDEALPELYSCADLFVLCTREDLTNRGVEGFGMAFLEAQAAGVPVIGTRAGGIPDAIIEGRGGWLISQDDVNALTTHLENLSRDPRPFQQQGALGLVRVRQEATWENYVDQLLLAMAM